jgi:hypothetical protein
MKTEFGLKWGITGNNTKSRMSIQTMDIYGNSKVRALIEHDGQLLSLEGKDLERFACNVLIALKSQFAPKIGRIDESKYFGIHGWLKRTYGAAKVCQNPDCEFKDAKKFEWALKKGRKYEKNVGNFLQLCVTCHRRYDETEDSKANKSFAARNRLNRPMRAVKKLDKRGALVKQYKSVSHAAADNQRSVSAITLAAGGKTKSCAGFKWEYV